MTGERSALTETLSPTELGRQAYDAMQNVLFRLINNQDFARATANQFFSRMDSMQIYHGLIDRTIKFEVTNGHTWEVNFQRRKSIRNLGQQSLVHGESTPLLEDYTGVWVVIERQSEQNKKLSDGKMILGSDFQIKQTQVDGHDKPVISYRNFIDGKIEVPGAKPNSKTALAEIPNFLADFYPKLAL
jgi:hypothetical protein